MTIDSAKDLQMNIAKEGLALLMFHPSFNVQPHRECSFLIGTAWDIPVGDTQEVISLLDRELDAIRAAGEGGTVAHVLPEDELPINATGWKHWTTSGTCSKRACAWTVCKPEQRCSKWQSGWRKAKTFWTKSCRHRRESMHGWSRQTERSL